MQLCKVSLPPSQASSILLPPSPNARLLSLSSCLCEVLFVGLVAEFGVGGDGVPDIVKPVGLEMG